MWRSSMLKKCRLHRQVLRGGGEAGLLLIRCGPQDSAGGDRRRQVRLWHSSNICHKNKYREIHITAISKIIQFFSRYPQKNMYI